MHLYRSKPASFTKVDLSLASFDLDNPDYFFLLAYPDYTDPDPVLGARLRRTDGSGVSFNYFDFVTSDFPILFRVDYTKTGLDHPDNFDIEWINSPGMGVSNFGNFFGDSRIIRSRTDQLNFWAHTKTDFQNDIAGKFDKVTFVDVHAQAWEREDENAPLIFTPSSTEQWSTIQTVSFDTIVDKIVIEDPFNATITTFENTDKLEYFKMMLDVEFFGGNYLKVYRDGVEKILYLGSTSNNQISRPAGYPAQTYPNITGTWKGLLKDKLALPEDKPAWHYVIEDDILTLFFDDNYTDFVMVADGTFFGDTRNYEGRTVYVKLQYDPGVTYAVQFTPVGGNTKSRTLTTPEMDAMYAAVIVGT